ncbi:MAG: cobalamin-binding protein [Hydrogenophilales bacterium]|nr:cobalamin-binding protein [Hydrogenophilales bacterium]
MKTQNLFTAEDAEDTEVLFNTPLRGEKRKYVTKSRHITPSGAANRIRSWFYSASSASSAVHAFLFFWAIAFTPAHADITVRDDTGQILRLAAPPRRIVSLAPHATELLFEAGAGSRIVGAVSYSDYPEEARRIPRVGGYRALDMEAIAALKPDLIVAWPSGNTPAQVEKLKQLGLPIYLSEPKRITDIASALERLGELTGNTGAAQQAAARFNRQHAALRAAYTGRPPVRVFYQIWNSPLITVSGEQIIGDAIRLCGGENIFASLPALTATVSLEAVLQANPEVIVASGMAAQRPAWLDDWKRWPRLRAAMNNQLHFIPADWINRASPRLLQGAERLCGILDGARKGNGAQ